MKAGIEYIISPTTVRLAPSLRLPVTPDNRELLRRLRAAEQSAWEAGLPVDMPRRLDRLARRSFAA